MVADAGAVFAAGVAVVLLGIFAEGVFEVGGVGVGCCVFASGVVDVAADFEVEFGRFAGGCEAIGGGEGFAGGGDGLGGGLEGLQAARGIGCDAEVASEGWANIGGALVGIDLSSMSVWRTV